MLSFVFSSELVKKSHRVVTHSGNSDLGSQSVSFQALVGVLLKLPLFGLLDFVGVLLSLPLFGLVTTTELK